MVGKMTYGSHEEAEEMYQERIAGMGARISQSQLEVAKLRALFGQLQVLINNGAKRSELSALITDAYNTDVTLDVLEQQLMGLVDKAEEVTHRITGSLDVSHAVRESLQDKVAELVNRPDHHTTHPQMKA